MTGGIKDGRGTTRTKPHITLLIPNRKAKHRSKGNRIVWKYELRYWQNRYYARVRPRVRVILKALGLRK